MGVSYRPMTGAAVPVRTGVERATLVRRTYLLVLASILVTMFGVSFSMSTPPVFNWAARHPILTMLGMFLPLFGALRFRNVFPTNIGLVFLFTFIEGIFISPFIYVLGQTQPGVVGQAAFLSLATNQFAAFEKFASLNANAIKTAFEDSIANARALAGAKDVQELVNLQSTFAHPEIEKAITY